MDPGLENTSVWELAETGQAGNLHLGMTEAHLRLEFGPPTHKAHHILKYDEIELHLDNMNRLWLLHCEFGERPLPPAVQSSRLRIEADVFAWPLSTEEIVDAATSRGFKVVEDERFDMRRLQFGYAEVLIDQDDELCSWSIHAPSVSPTKTDWPDSAYRHIADSSGASDAKPSINFVP